MGHNAFCFIFIVIPLVTGWVIIGSKIIDLIVRGFDLLSNYEEYKKWTNKS